jgi:hypothetical protein
MRQESFPEALSNSQFYEGWAVRTNSVVLKLVSSSRLELASSPWTKAPVLSDIVFTRGEEGTGMKVAIIKWKETDLVRI